MKYKTLALSIIAILVLFSAAYSQTPERETTNDEGSVEDKREIEKFADEFIEDLRLTDDISQVSERFFVGDFKTRLAKNGSLNFPVENDDLKAQFSDSDLYYNKVAFNNLFNLLAMYESEKEAPGDSDQITAFDESLIKSLPPHVIDLMRNSKWLKPFSNYGANDDEDSDESGGEEIYEKKLASVEDIRSLTQDLNTVSYALRAEIIQQNMELPKSLENSEYFPGEKCEGKRCFGLPENTVIFSIHKYLMCLRIARINNELKIVELFSVVDED